MRNRPTHGLGWRGHWLDMLGGSAGKVNEAPGLPAPKMIVSAKSRTPTMMDYGARAGIANYVNCGILRLSRRSNFGIRGDPATSASPPSGFSAPLLHGPRPTDP